MIKYFFTLALIVSPISIIAAAENCDDMAQQLGNSYKLMANNYSQSIGDDSAPRETNRQLKDLNQQIRQLVIIEYMKANQCNFDDNPGRMNQYLISVLKCSRDQREGNVDSPACDMERWVPSE